MEGIAVHEDLLSSNIKASDNYLSSTSFWVGMVTSHRYKVIDGYRIACSPLSGQYDWDSQQ